MKLFKSLDLLNQYLELKIEEVKEEGKKRANHLIHANIKSIEKISGKITAWSLTVVGGTFLAILSDEYVHPEKRELKYAYFIFVIAWACIGRAIYFGMRISGSASAADRNADNLTLLEAGYHKCQCYFRKQRSWFNWGLAALFIWLLLYLGWWIFAEAPIKKLINL